MLHPWVWRATQAAFAAALCLSGLSVSGCAASTPGSANVAITPTASIGATAAATNSATTSTPSISSSPTPSVMATCPKAKSGFRTRAPGSGKTVALTFDDGPGTADAQIAQILTRYHITATFFETGAHAAADPATVRLLANNGNLIAGHSWDHDYPDQVSGGWTVRYLRDQFSRTDKELSGLTGSPVCFVRPPGGIRTNVLTTTQQLNLTAVLWSTDAEDWRQPGRTTSAATNAIVTNATAVSGNAHPIVLLHSAKASHESDAKVSPYRGNTIAALPRIIEWYQKHNYRFVTMASS
jgi:peptidoglycan-N-acetylglucosamine deacetylase